MTEKEIEKVVATKVEEALKEFKKILPSIKDTIKEVEKALSKLDTKALKDKIDDAVDYVHYKMRELKSSSEKNEIAIKINNKKSQKQLDQIKKEIDSLQEKVEARPIEIEVKEEGSEAGGKIQNIVSNLGNLSTAVNNVVQNGNFPDWLKNCVDRFAEMSNKMAETDWQQLINMCVQVGTKTKGMVSTIDIIKIIATSAIEAISSFIGMLSGGFNWISETIMLIGIAIVAIGAIALGVPAAIAAVIAIIVAVVATAIVLIKQHWEEISAFVMNIVNAIIEFFQNLWNQVSFIFQAIWEVISTILGFIGNLFKTVFEAIWNIVSPIVNAVWNIISTIFEAIWNVISSILNSIWNIFSQVFNWVWQLISKVFEAIWNIISPVINRIWETIKFVLGKIQEVWSTVWNVISDVVNRVWNGIWNGIKTVINFILGGIESFVNGTIKGINLLLSGISSVANAIGSLIGLDPINLQISTISLPRLAKGGVLTRATAVIAGEYSGAKTNPEIVTPQNIMYETMVRALTENDIGKNNNGKPVRVQIYWGTKNVLDEIIDGINEKSRRTGRAQIKVAYE